MILIVTYDLKGSSDYALFFDALKAQGAWWHYMSSTWLLSTTRTPKEVFESLHPHMLSSDWILVWRAGDEYYGWLPKDAWDWINKNHAPAIHR